MSKQEKVQFFNSESSFGSQSNLADSRYFDLTNQIVEQTENIFHTLKKQFQPHPEQTNYDKIDYLQNRAKILAQDTIPDHVSYLKKIQSPPESIEACQDCVQRLQKFKKDYKSLKEGLIIHKQFYNIYCKEQQNLMFFKKDNQQKKVGFSLGTTNKNGMLEPDVESIGQIKSSRAQTLQNYRYTERHRTTVQSDKQVIELQQEIAQMKKQQADLKKQFQYMLTAQKLNCEKRVNALLKTITKRNQNPYSGSDEQYFQNETIRLGEQVQTLLKYKQNSYSQNVKLERRIQDLQRQNENLKDELIRYRKMQNSRMDDEDNLNRSFQSEQNQDDSRDLRKLTLQIKKLTSERDILKSQLMKERQLSEKERQNAHSNQSKQLIRVKGYLQSRNKQIEELQRQLDKSRVQIIQMRQQNKVLNKNITTMKDTSEQLKRTLHNFDNLNQQNGLSLNTSIMQNGKVGASGNLISFKSRLQINKALQKSNVSNLKPSSFEQYIGQGIQGHPYYELLSRQFKIRFRRACLKQKELLYKANGLQIGVITEFTAPNIIKVLVHITNSSEINIRSLKFKAMNPNQNKIDCEIDEIKLLEPNQQVKVPVIIIIKNYPIGPLVLAIDYLNDEKHDVRLLLPAHIFKCVTFEPRRQPFYNSKKLTIKAQKKICKDIHSLREYFNVPDHSQIKVKIQHEHSGSSMFFNVSYQKEDITLEYEHITGTQKFTQYFIKTFKTLLQKQH